MLATGNTTVNDGALAQLDPANLANGFYQLRLTATDISGRTAQTLDPDRDPHGHQAQRHRGDRRRPERQPRRHDDPDPAHLRPAQPRRHAATSATAGAWSTARRISRPTCRRRARKTSASTTPFRDGTEALPDAAHRPARPLHVRADELPGRRPDVLPPGLAGGQRASPTPCNRPMPCSRRRATATTTWRPASRTTPAIRSSADRATRSLAPDGTQYQLDAQGNIIGEITPIGAQLYISDSGITAANGRHDPVPARRPGADHEHPRSRRPARHLSI